MSASRLLAVLLDLADGRESAAFSAIAEHAAGVLRAEAAGVLRFLGDERAVVVGVWRQGGRRGMPINAELDFDSRNSALGRARSTRRPARADTYEGLRGELPLVMEAIGLRASVAAPIVLDDRPWGAIAVATAREEPLPADSEELLGELAALVAQAYAGGEGRRALEASRLRLVEVGDDARRRLERELHEGPHQHLLALVLKLRVARAKAPDGSALAVLLDEAIAGALDADGSLRDLGRGIYPVVLSERGLAAAVQAVAVRARVPVNMRRLPSRRFPALIEATAYFTVVEALANVPADASEVAVEVGDDGDHMSVEVRHDGTGDTGAPRIADRAAAVGGRLELSAPPDGGRVLRLELPFSS
jgi:signal transduction histidine kinase